MGVGEEGKRQGRKHKQDIFGRENAYLGIYLTEVN